MTLKTMPQPRFWAEDFHGFFDDFAIKNLWLLVVFIPCQAFKFGFKTWKQLGILTPPQKNDRNFLGVQHLPKPRDLWHNSSIPLIGCRVLGACWCRVAALQKRAENPIPFEWDVFEQPVKMKNKTCPPFFPLQQLQIFEVKKKRHL